MSHLRAPAARADRREGGRHGRPVARTASATAETHIRPQLLRLAVLPPIAVALSGCAAVLFTVRSTGARPSATLWAVLTGAVTVTGVGILIAAVAADRAARSVSDRIGALRRNSARGEADLRALVEALRRGEVPPQRKTRGGPPADADDFELLAADLARAHDGAVTAVVRAAQLSSQAGSEQKLEVFVNLARRLQSLVHREISILDELENEIEDPDLLKGLFHVDHLATRIRRHAENLAVLGGAVSRRQWSNPVSMTEVLRSAIAEVEQYSRVRLVPPIDGELRGHAVADVIHLLAELVENATVFSAPHTQVLLRANLVTSGLAVEVEDRGLGLPVDEQKRMNALLADPDQVNVGRLLADGRIGLFVVSQLARRHGIRVRLQTNIYGGVQAVLVVPQALLGSVPGLPDVAPQGADTPTPAPPEGTRSTQDARPAAGPNGRQIQGGRRSPSAARTRPRPDTAATPTRPTGNDTTRPGLTPVPPQPHDTRPTPGTTSPSPSPHTQQDPGHSRDSAPEHLREVSGSGRVSAPGQLRGNSGSGRESGPGQLRESSRSGRESAAGHLRQVSGSGRESGPGQLRGNSGSGRELAPGQLREVSGSGRESGPGQLRGNSGSGRESAAEHLRQDSGSGRESAAGHLRQDSGSGRELAPGQLREVSGSGRESGPGQLRGNSGSGRESGSGQLRENSGSGRESGSEHRRASSGSAGESAAGHFPESTGGGRPLASAHLPESTGGGRPLAPAHLPESTSGGRPLAPAHFADDTAGGRPAGSSRHQGSSSSAQPLTPAPATQGAHRATGSPQSRDPFDAHRPVGSGQPQGAVDGGRSAVSAQAQDGFDARGAQARAGFGERPGSGSGGGQESADAQQGVVSAQGHDSVVAQSSGAPGDGRPAPLPVRGAQEARPNPADAVPGIRAGERWIVEENSGQAPVPRAGAVRGTMGKPTLPRRRAQEHIVPQLRGGPVPRQEPEQLVGHDPGLMAAFQRGIGLAEAQQSLEADPSAPSAPYSVPPPVTGLPPETYGARDALDVPGPDQPTARHDGSAPAG